MDDLKERVTAAIGEVLNKYFEAPERNWPHATHQAIANVRHELLSRVQAEFDRNDNDTAPAVEDPAEAEE